MELCNYSSTFFINSIMMEESFPQSKHDELEGTDDTSICPHTLIKLLAERQTVQTLIRLLL